MVNTLGKIHRSFAHLLKLKTTDGAKVDPTSSSAWTAVSPIVRSFLNSLLNILAQSKERTMLQFILQSARHYVPYFCAFASSLGKKFVKALVGQWGSTSDMDAAVRLTAFYRLRQVASHMPAGSPLMERCLKSAYLAFVRGAKFSSAQNQDRLAIQAHCLVDLFSIDAAVTYEIAFVYIRQLALHLRSALTTRKQDSVKSVYSWQYVHCLRLWGLVMCAHAEKATEIKNAADPEEAGSPSPHLPSRSSNSWHCKFGADCAALSSATAPCRGAHADIKKYRRRVHSRKHAPN